MPTKQKINWLLILQAWAMLWVVIGHAGPSPELSDYPPYALFIWEFAYSFHMPLFITISGFLFYLTRLNNEKWNYVDTMKEKLVRFGIPFVFFTIIGIIIKSVFSSSVTRATTISFGEFLNAILYPYNGPMRNFWFLATILWFFMLFPVWKVILRNKWLSIITFVCFCFVQIKHPQTDFLAIRSVGEQAIFFYSGLLCAKGYIKRPDSLDNRIFAPCVFVTGVFIYVVGRLYNIPLLAPWGGVFFSLSIALWLDKLFPRTFSSFRDYTYQIFLLSIFAQFVLSFACRRYGWSFNVVYVISMFAGIYVPVLISKVIEWINWTPLLLCVGLKKKKE